MNMSLKELEHTCPVSCIGQCRILILFGIGYIELPNGRKQSPIFFCPYCGKKLTNKELLDKRLKKI